MSLSQTVASFRDRVEPTIAAIQVKIAALEAQIAAGTSSPEDVAELNRLAGLIEAVK